MVARYHKRRAKAIEAMGGKCVRCGSEDRLEFDHIERSLKAGEIARWLSRGEQRYLRELEKCQLLCRACHIEKSRGESSVGHGGGKTGIRNCYCEKCKPLKLAYMREWKRKQRQENGIN